MTREEYLQAVKIAFASQYALYAKAQGFHWNVRGLLFPMYHEFFGDIYGELGDSLDKFAEEIRTLQTDAPAGLTSLAALSQIKDSTANTSQAMLNELYADCEKMIVVIETAYEAAEEAHDHGFSNFLAERLDAFQKHCWMLRSSLA